MSSFLMGYPSHHHQTTMGAGYEPKFPPTEDYHLHNGYGGSMNAMSAQTNPMEYNYGQNYNYGHQGIASAGHFYHHHHPYASSAQMHHTSSTVPTPASLTPTASQSNNYGAKDYKDYGLSNSASVGLSPSATNSLNCNESNSSGAGYYNGYYGTSNGHHQMLDLPLQCPPTEPSNTALGLQELGECFWCF